MSELQLINSLKEKFLRNGRLPLHEENMLTAKDMQDVIHEKYCHIPEWQKRAQIDGQRLQNSIMMFNAAGDVNIQDLGSQFAIDTLTWIKKKVSEQKFYTGMEYGLTDFVPIAIGEGQFQQSIITNLSFMNSDDFETGNINTGTSDAKLSQVNASVSHVSQAVKNWGKEISYSIFDINQALASLNWDAIEGKHKARKKNFDQGLLKVLFLGLRSDTNVTGLLNNADISINTDLITTAISLMDPNDFANFVSKILDTYTSNTEYTQLPNRLVIPTPDFLGLSTPVSPSFPNISKLEYLQKAFNAQVSGFKIIHTPYSSSSKLSALAGISNVDRYVLYNYDDTTLRMDMPLDYTVTQPNSTNNFTFQDVAYCQYTGVGVFRKKEILYLDRTV